MHDKPWEILEYKIRMETDFTRSNTDFRIISSSTLSTEYTPSPIQRFEGITLNLRTETDGAGALVGYHQAHLRIPDLGYERIVSFDDFNGDFHSHLEIKNFRLYNSFSVWNLIFDEIDWYVKGVLVDTIEFRALPTAIFTPCSIPIIGMPATLLNSCGFNPKPLEGGAFNPSAFSGTVDNKTTGGWRFKPVGEGFVVLPISRDIKLLLGSGDVTFLDGDLAGDDTYNLEVNCHATLTNVVNDLGNFECPCPPEYEGTPAIYNVKQNVLTLNEFTGSLMALPNLAKSLNKWNDDYRELIERNGIPGTSHRSESQCCELFWEDTYPGISEDDCGLKIVIDTPVHSSKLRKRASVGNDFHNVLDALNATSFAPYSKSAGLLINKNFEATLVSPGFCTLVDPPPPEMPATADPVCDFSGLRYVKKCGSTVSFPRTQNRTQNTHMLPYLNHLEMLPRYLNYVAHPHWSYRTFFPKNNNEDLQNEWLMYDSPIDVAYWLKIRQQWQASKTQAIENATKTRNNLCSAPLLKDANQELLKIIFGVESSWLGLGRFIINDLDIPENVTLDENSEDSWSITGGNATFTAGGIEVESVDGLVILEYDLTQFEREPFLLPFLFKQITLNWLPVDNVKVYITNQNNEKFLITDVPGTFEKPVKDDRIYACSYGQDFGVGMVQDEGTDTLSNGRSSSTMNDNVLVHALELSRGREGSKLRFELDFEPLDEVVIEYPIFIFDSDTIKTLSETGQSFMILFENGSGCRFGQWKFWNEDIDEFVYPPVVREIDTGSTVLDYLAGKRIMFHGLGAEDALDAEIQSYFDTFEGNERIDAVYNSLAFITPESQICLVNTHGACPPLACFPVLGWKRVLGKLERSENYVQEVWSFAQSPQYYVNSRDSVFIGKEVNDIWSEPINIIDGWLATKHESPVENNEGDEFPLFNNEGLVFGKASPWHGYLCLFTKEFEIVSIHKCTSTPGLVFLVIAYDNGIKIWKYDLESVNETLDVYESENISWVQIARKQDGALHVSFVENGEVFIIKSYAWGEEWSQPEMITTGTIHAHALDIVSGIEYIAIYDDGNWNLWKKLDDDSAWINTGIIVSANEGSGALEVRYDKQRNLIFTLIADGELRRFISSDLGDSWEEA